MSACTKALTLEFLLWLVAPTKLAAQDYDSLCCHVSIRCPASLLADIKPGQGLYRIRDASGGFVFQARNCDDNTYGISRVSYGLRPYVCRTCPTNMVTSSDAINFPNSASFFADHGNGTRGFTDPKACVTQAGYEYASRVSTPCSAGKYNPKDTWGRCTACPYGTSTAGLGAGSTAADCKLAPGFGSYNGERRPCPAGEWFVKLRTFTASKDMQAAVIWSGRLCHSCCPEVKHIGATGGTSMA